MPAQAVTFTETFPDPLGQWTSGWLYQNSNLENYYIASGSSSDPNHRGNNPTGLWIADTQGFNSGAGGDSTIVFNPSFGALITYMEFGIEAFTNTTITFRDMSNNVLGVYNAANGSFPLDHELIISQSSGNGISSIEFVSGAVEGNTSIDNVIVEQVPEPATMIALAVGIAGLAARRRARR